MYSGQASEETMGWPMASTNTVGTDSEDVYRVNGHFETNLCHEIMVNRALCM